MSAFASELHAIGRQVQRGVMRGEAVIVMTVTNDITVSHDVDDVIVSIDPAGVGDYGTGPAKHQARLSFAETHRDLLLTCVLATVRGEEWHVVAVGDVYGGEFTVELRRDEQIFTNIRDMDDDQAVWEDP